MVYIITDDSGYVKIGTTGDYSLRNRIKQLQCGNPRNLRVLKEICINPYRGIHVYRRHKNKRVPVSDYEIEHLLHIEFSSYMSRNENLEKNEWFKEECVESILNMDDLQLQDYLEDLVDRLWEPG